MKESLNENVKQGIMKWTKQAFDGSRFVKRFLWLPKKLSGELRWLKTVYIRLEWRGCIDWGWEEVSWATEKDYRDADVC